MSKINLTIDGVAVEVDYGSTIMEAAYAANIDIPRLCYVKGIHEDASCRVCVVEIEGMNTLKNSCSVKAEDGMVVKTKTKRVKNAVKANLELTAANHVFECWVCSREHNCELLDLMRSENIANPLGEDPYFTKKERILNNKSTSIVLDSGKCTNCGRCVSACDRLTGLHILDFNNRGSETYVGPALLNDMDDSGCIHCGKCLQHCPVGAIVEQDSLSTVKEYLNDEDSFVVVQAAPAVRAALGEEFGMPLGTNVEGKMYQAFKQLGFDDILDVNFGADLTILEEGTEFLQRLNDPKGVFPMFTSCSPGWIRYIERYQPDMINHLSSAKSPNQMTGAMAKHYYADKIGVDKTKMKVVAVMPCIAKKDEIERPENRVGDLKDVDAVITTRELARLIKHKKIDFVNLEDYKPTSELAKYTGAGLIFGATGGVMEAALRTVADKLEGKSLDKIEYQQVRGIKDFKEATLTLAGMEINIAVVHGGRAIGEFFKHIETCGKEYHFVEFMGCTGGCVNGGGQPLHNARTIESIDLRQERAKALYSGDSQMAVRKSHENETVIKIYEEFLQEPCSHLAHELLHTTYSPKEIYANHEQGCRLK